MCGLLKAKWLGEWRPEIQCTVYASKMNPGHGLVFVLFAGKQSGKP
jgi:hypothetical protein